MAEQLDLQRIARGEAGMAPLAGERAMLLSIPVQPCFAQPGAGGDDRGVPKRIRDPLIKQHKILWSQQGEAIGGGFEVIEQQEAYEMQLMCELPSIDDPRQVHHFTASISDRSGDPQAG